MAGSTRKMDNIDITEMQVVPCTNSPYIQASRVTFKQNGVNRIWDYIRMHDGVFILLYNTTRQAFVLVKQFRPALYVTVNREEQGFENDTMRKDHAQKIDSSVPYTAPYRCGVSYELCAGMVDKQLSLLEIAKEEALEECGYDIPVEKIKRAASWRSELGTTCNKHTLFYAEVSDDMLVRGAGGGNANEGEFIDLFYLPVSEMTPFMYNESLPKEPSLLFALSWWKDQCENRNN